MKSKTTRFLIFFVLVQLLLFSPLFLPGYPKTSGSIEPAFASFVEFLKTYPFSSWNPQWYFGFPTRFFGPPVIPMLALLLSFITGSVVMATRMVAGGALVLFTISFFFLARRVVRSEFAALVATALFSFLPSVLYFFPAVFDIGFQIGFVPWQVMLAGYFGATRHIAGLALLPVALLFYDRTMTNWGHRNIVVTSILFGLILLIDFETVLSLFLAVLVFYFIHARDGRWEEMLRKTFIVWLIGGGLTLWWYTPRMIIHIGQVPILAGKSLISVVWELTQQVLTFLPVVLAVFAVKWARYARNKPWVVATLWTLSFSALTLVLFVTDYDFVSQFTKFGVELQMGIALTFGLAVQHLWWKRKTVAMTYILAIFLLSLFSVVGIPSVVSREKDVRGRIEYQVAQSLQKHGAIRAYLSGSTSFWLNLFSDIEQVRGGVDMASIHPWWAHASYQIREGKDAEMSVLWLKALRVSHIVVHSDRSQEFFHDFSYPKKFTKSLAVSEEITPSDVMYEISEPGGVLAYAVARTQGEKLSPPRKGDNKRAIATYVAWLEKGRKLQVDKKTPGRYVITGEVREEEDISVGYAFDSQWIARDKTGQRLAVRKDALGFIVVVPRHAGQEEILLTRSVPWIDMASGFLLFGVVVGGIWYYPKYPERFSRIRNSYFGKMDVDEQLEY